MSEPDIENAARAARAAYGNWFGGWDDDAACPEYKRNDWRNVARAVLDAAQPEPSVPAGDDVAAVLGELRADLEALRHHDYLTEAGVLYARALVEAAQRKAATGARAVGLAGLYEENQQLKRELTAAQLELRGHDIAGLAATIAEAEQALERGEVSTLDEVFPPTPSAPGVAELLAECARRKANVERREGHGFNAAMTCDEIVRLLAPGGADGTESDGG